MGVQKFRPSNFKKSKNKAYVGHIGESPSQIIDEYEFESLEDFTIAPGQMGQPQLKQFSDAIASFIYSGAPKNGKCSGS